MEYLFWISVLILGYHILGYGIILRLINLFQKKKELNQDTSIEFPSITVLCPAFNEEDVIEEKLKSFLELDYPQNKIKMIVISDDSTDKTNEIVLQYSDRNISLIIQRPRQGKQSGHNMVEPLIDTEYILSTDANSIFHPQAVKHLIKKAQSDPETGMVSGELRLVKKNRGDSGEGLYWKYESWLKSEESKFYSIIGANGSIFLIRRDLFTQIHPASVDDFERSLQVLQKGFKVKYEPDAKVFEETTARPVEEIGRKIRIITQEWFCLARNLQVLNPVRDFRVFFMFISHKLIRWLLPVFSFLMLVTNIFLLDKALYVVCFMMQISVYLSGLYEIQIEKSGKSIKLFKITAYYTAMNYSAMMALFRYFRKHQYATWQKVR